jgi:hypothetical protein
MLHRVALVRTDVSEDLSGNVLRVLVTAYVVPSSRILSTLIEAIHSSETSVLTRVTRRRIPEDDILHRFVNFLHRENHGYTRRSRFPQKGLFSLINKRGQTMLICSLSWQ